MSQEFPQAPDGNRQESNLSGAVLGDFLLLRLLGRGGMAEVYLAEQQSLRRQVAFKILRRDLAEDPQYVQRFHQEARAAARLVQANIVQIYEVGKSDGLHYIAQEYVKGQNLKQYLHRHGAVDSLLAVNIMRQVASALVKAAENRVTHRDIKPENILLATNGEVKVADFGLARVVAEGQKNHLTQVGITMGTPLYMSPEQVEGKAVDPRSDLYSFGVTCYEMLAGRPPFEGETPLNVAVQHLKKEADPLNQIRPDVPAQLCEMIGTLMNKSPEARYESAAALLKDLRSVQVDEADERWLETLQQLEVAEKSTMTSQLASTQQLDVLMKQESTALKLPSRSRWLAGVAILCVFAFLTGCGVAFLRQPPDLLQVNSAAGRGIPIQKSVEGQLRYAQRFPSEKAWLAVSKNFPVEDSSTNRYYGLLADIQLGELYLQQRAYELALERYRGLETYNVIDRRFYPVSLVGQSIALYRLGKTFQAEQALFAFDEALLESMTMDAGQESPLISDELLSMFNAVRRESGSLEVPATAFDP